MSKKYYGKIIMNSITNKTMLYYSKSDIRPDPLIIVKFVFGYIVLLVSKELIFLEWRKNK